MSDFDIYLANLKIWKDRKNIWIGIKEDVFVKIFLNVVVNQGVENTNIGIDSISKTVRKHFFQIFLKDICRTRLKDANLLFLSIKIQSFQRKNIEAKVKDDGLVLNHLWVGKNSGILLKILGNEKEVNNRSARTGVINNLVYKVGVLDSNSVGISIEVKEKDSDFQNIRDSEPDTVEPVIDTDNRT